KYKMAFFGIILQNHFSKMILMTRKIVFNSTAILSTLGILCWIITDFFGGMMLYLFTYGIFIVPLIVLYIISLGDTLLSMVKIGVRANKIKVIFHGTLFFLIILFNLYHSDIFKSKRILTATLKDDLYYYTLIFRKNGMVENEINGIFGFQETIKGSYQISGDTIIFTKVPYDNDFIPEKLLFDKEQHAIFMYRDENGHFVQKKEWLKHFEIE